MEIRVSNDSVEITGYVNAVERQSSPIRDETGYFTETIKAGAFAEALRENPNVPMLLNHDSGRVIAEGAALDLREDAIGLHVRATITDPEVVDKARSDRLRGWSFGFVPLSMSDDTKEGQLRHRNVQRMDLREVSLLDDSKRPAYPATSVYTRDDGEQCVVEFRSLETDTTVTINAPTQDPPDLSQYRAVLDELGTI